MGKHVKVSLLLLIGGIVAIIGYKILSHYQQESTQLRSSDARDIKGKIVIGVDNWIGYFPLCSQRMTRSMRASGYSLVCEDDNADYPQRMKRLASGEYQFAVATVDSYLLNGVREKYPGSIITVIDESRGGDAAVAWEEKISNLDALKRASNIKVAFTPDSPSHHMLKSMGVHFDIPLLHQSGWQLESNGSSDALKRFLQKDAEVAVLWEPDVSRALSNDGVVKLLGTEDTNKLIVDILLVNRAYSLNNSEVVGLLLRNYFYTLKHYRDQDSDLLDEAAEYTGIEGDTLKSLLKGVSWKNLSDNVSDWFGVSGGVTEEGLIEAIVGAMSVLQEAGDFSDNPIPDTDPYRLTNSQFVEALYKRGAGGGQWGSDNAALQGEGPSLERRFSTLTNQQWEQLRDIGTLKVRPIVFQSGTSNLTLDGKNELDKAMENLKHYPNFRVVVKGHTGLSGDKHANKQLSQKRAESVVRYLEITYGVDANRLHPLGMGDESPLPRNPGESLRAYNYRLPRVELSLAVEDI